VITFQERVGCQTTNLPSADLLPEFRVVPDASSGEITGLHYLTSEPLRVLWREGVITQVAPDSHRSDLPWLAPSLCDVQVNGYGGVDFQQDDVSLDELVHAAERLRKDACARFFLTLITDEWSVMMSRLERLRRLRASSPFLQRSLLGWHIEGPFLSEKPGFYGAHDPALMIDPRPEHIIQLRQVVGSDPVFLTLAPERNGAIEVIRAAVEADIRVSLGHTDASAEVLMAAVQAGAFGFTHLGNGCQAELNRHDNILWRVLDSDRLCVSLIPDAIHVSPQLFRLFHRVLPGDRIYYTTDAMAAAGAGEGEFSIGPRVVSVGEDGAVRQPGTPYLAGSALRPCEGVRRAAKMLACSWREAWQRASELPACHVGIENTFRAGESADFVILDHASA
jgi:N-acetylglucosamine-6-phosphate deacetylase